MDFTFQVLMPSFHYLLLTSSSLVLCPITSGRSHCAFSSLTPLEFLFFFSYAQPELFAFHDTAASNGLEIILTVHSSLWKPQSQSSLLVSRWMDAAVIYSSEIISRWLGKGKERMLTEYICLLTVPDYKLGFFQLGLSLTWVYSQNVCFWCSSSKRNVALLCVQWYHMPAPSALLSHIQNLWLLAWNFHQLHSVGQGLTEVGIETSRRLIVKLVQCLKCCGDLLKSGLTTRWVFVSLEDTLDMGSFFILPGCRASTVYQTPSEVTDVLIS